MKNANGWIFCQKMQPDPFFAAHSMGNVVVGEALRLVASGTTTTHRQFAVRSYVASQAALPAQGYRGGDADYPSDIAPAYSVNAFQTANVYKDWYTPNRGAVLRRVNFFNTNDYALWHDKWELNQGLKPNRQDLGVQPYEYAFTGNPSLPATDNSFMRNQTPNLHPLAWEKLTISKLSDRYLIMAFAAESWSRALGRVSLPQSAMAASVDLQSLWSNGSGIAEKRNAQGQVIPYSAHKWHSAQFRSSHALQFRYWQALVSQDGFQLIAPNDLPKPPTNSP